MTANHHTPLSGSASGLVDFNTRLSDLDSAITANASQRLRVKNSSGATADNGDVGYIDEAGEYQTTTTEKDNRIWCVVTDGGANGASITIKRRGNVTVNYTGTAPAKGDFLFTSTTAGSAIADSTPSTMMFAVCTAGGSGGQVEALLLTGTQFVPATSSNDLFGISSHSLTQFESSISGTPSATSVVYGSVTAGSEDTIEVTAATHLAKIRLHNTTRETYRLIESVDVATNTITTVSSSDAWASGDSITAESQTASISAPVFFDLDLSQQTDIPKLARGVVVQASVNDSGGGGERLDLHPFGTYSNSKRKSLFNQVTFIFSVSEMTVPLIEQAFVLRRDASGTGTASTFLKLVGYFVAVP